MRKMHLETI